MNWSEWAAVSTLAFMAIASPGPSFALVIHKSLTTNRRQGLLTACGVALGDLALALANLFGLGLLLAKAPFALTAVKWAGGLYLVYLGARGLRAQPRLMDMPAPTGQPSPRTFYQGFITVILNPKALIFFLSLFSVIIAPQTPRLSRLFYALSISVISLCWFTVVTLFFTNPTLQKRFMPSMHWVERFTGLILLGFAAALLW
jgi:RhtB (resistance to homoserine/threonine) family protein